jgi:hypothetical protein
VVRGLESDAGNLGSNPVDGCKFKSIQVYRCVYAGKVI